MFGKSSEKLTPVEAELKKQDEHNQAARKEKAKAKRRQNAEAKNDLPTDTLKHRVPEKDRVCKKCGRKDLFPLGPGRKTIVYEYVPARLIRREHIQETLACQCSEFVIVADGAPKVIEKGRYGASFLAHLVVAKCCDSIPIYRLEKEFRRCGIPIARSTMNQLLHRTAEMTSLLVTAMFEELKRDTLVHADETPMRVLAEKKCRIGYLWTFRNEKLIGYRFSPSRSGKTPQEVLGGTQGSYVTDAYSGYNRLKKVSGRKRGGCHAHVRRRFFDAQRTAPVAKEALDFILDLYRTEYEAKERGIIGTEAHLLLRRKRSLPIRRNFHRWLVRQRPLHPPKSPIGTAIRYALKNWKELGLFLREPRMPLDNNRAEAALRVAALGRKNYLFVGSDKAGSNLAGLYSLVATCEANGVNPTEYFTDILERVQTHPASRISELLPHRWHDLIKKQPPKNDTFARAGP